MIKLLIDKDITIEDLERYLATNIERTTNDFNYRVSSNILFLHKGKEHLNLRDNILLYYIDKTYLEFKIPKNYYLLVTSYNLFKYNLGRKKIIEFLLTKLKKNAVI